MGTGSQVRNETIKVAQTKTRPRNLHIITYCQKTHISHKNIHSLSHTRNNDVEQDDSSDENVANCNENKLQNKKPLVLKHKDSGTFKNRATEWGRSEAVLEPKKTATSKSTVFLCTSWSLNSVRVTSDQPSPVKTWNMVYIVCLKFAKYKGDRSRNQCVPKME